MLLFLEPTSKNTTDMVKKVNKIMQLSVDTEKNLATYVYSYSAERLREDLVLSKNLFYNVVKLQKEQVGRNIIKYRSPTVSRAGLVSYDRITFSINSLSQVRVGLIPFDYIVKFIYILLNETVNKSMTIFALVNILDFFNIVIFEETELEPILPYIKLKQYLEVFDLIFKEMKEINNQNPAQNPAELASIKNQNPAQNPAELASKELEVKPK